MLYRQEKRKEWSCIESYRKLNFGLLLFTDATGLNDFTTKLILYYHISGLRSLAWHSLHLVACCSWRCFPVIPLILFRHLTENRDHLLIQGSKRLCLKKSTKRLINWLGSSSLLSQKKQQQVRMFNSVIKKIDHNTIRRHPLNQQHEFKLASVCCLQGIQANIQYPIAHN